jgi:hypothetical protein
MVMSGSLAGRLAQVVSFDGMEPQLEMEIDPLADQMFRPGMRRSMANPNVTGRRGEELMRCLLRSYGWIVMMAPYHTVTSHGPDAIAWRLRRPRQGFRPPQRLLILDNKAGRTPGTVRKAGGLTAPSLILHLPHFIYALRNAGPQHAGVSELLEQTFRAARVAYAQANQAGIDRRFGRIQLPEGVRLMVTNANGQATGVSARLRALGIGFGNLAARQIPERCRAYVDPVTAARQPGATSPSTR